MGGGESSLGGAMVVALERWVGLLRRRVCGGCVALEWWVGRGGGVGGVCRVSSDVVGSGHCGGREGEGG